MTESTTIARLVALWQTRVGIWTRRLALASLLSALVAAAHVARIGTFPARLAAAGAFALTLALIIVLRLRARRSLLSEEGVIRRVLLPTDPEQARRALRAQALLQRAEQDASVGSVELARLHLERALSRISLEAVGRTAKRLARRRAFVAAGLLASAAGAILIEPVRVVEGLNVLAARRGVAPLPLPWLSMVRVNVQAPAYLKASEQRIFPAFRNEIPQGSVVTVRGVPERPGRRLVLTDGEHEVPFVEDGSGSLVARWTLKESALLYVAARFGEVLVLERTPLDLEAVPDHAPRIELEGAPQTVELKDLDRIELRYLASDDHGLRQIDLVLRSGAREDRRVLMRLDGQSKLERGAHALDPRDAFLRRMFLPVVASIEARDNDVGASAKWGSSEAFTILPPTVGEPEALRFAALRAARERLVDLLDHQLSVERAKKQGPLGVERANEFKKTEKQLLEQAISGLRSAVSDSYAGIRVSSGLSAFVLGQVAALEKRTGQLRRRTEDVLLASDAGIRALGSRDAQQVAKRLGDVAEEVAEGAKLGRDSEQRPAGVRRLSLALVALEKGSANLVTLAGLGADLGSVAQGEIRRIRRAEAGQKYLEAELAARHLAARLRRPNPSFSSAGGGGVESGQGAPGPGEPSEADRQFDQLMRELEQLAAEHSEEIRRVEQVLDESEQTADSEELKQEAARRARALREQLDGLPRVGAQPGSARAAAALGREHMAAMAQSLEQLGLKDAVENGRSAEGSLEQAERLAKDPSLAANWLDEPALERAQREVSDHLAWAEQALARQKQQARARAAEDLARAGQRESELSRRAGNLAGRGAQSEVTLPDELQDALERAENAMQEAARELGAGRGDEGLSLQREAQRLLERSSSGRTSDGDDGQEQRSPSQGDGDGREPSSSGHVPAADKARRAEQFRKRVLEGLSGERRGRLGPAVERYAEGLLE